MKLLADENIARQIIERLRRDGNTVLSIAETASGSADDDVLDLANQQGAILLTDDKDFGDLVMFQRRPSQGIILVRLEGLSPADRAELVADVLRVHADELAGGFTVIKRQTVRTRPLPHD